MRILFFLMLSLPFCICWPALAGQATTRAGAAPSVTELVREIEQVRKQIPVLEAQLADEQKEQQMARAEAGMLEEEFRLLRAEGMGPAHARYQQVREELNQKVEELVAKQDAVKQTQAALEAAKEQVAAMEREMVPATERAAERAEDEAMDVAQAVRRRVEATTGAPDAAQRLHELIAQAELDKQRAQYEGLRKQLARTRELVVIGRATPSELTALETQVAVAEAELQRAEAQFMLEKLQRERGGFEERNAPGETAQAAMQTEFFRGYLDAVQRYADLSRDPLTSRVAAVVTAADMLRDQPPQATIDYFEPILDQLVSQRRTREAQDPAEPWTFYTPYSTTRSSSPPLFHDPTEAAVRLQLAEAYRAAGRTEEALQTLQALIVPTERATPSSEQEGAEQ